MVGVVSLVDSPRVGEAMTGGPGGVLVATVKFRAGVAGLTLPAASRASAVTLWAPGVRGPAMMQLKAPAASAIAVQAGVELPSR
jgi:hypothetical protein